MGLAVPPARTPDLPVPPLMPGVRALATYYERQLAGRGIIVAPADRERLERLADARYRYRRAEAGLTGPRRTELRHRCCAEIRRLLAGIERDELAWRGFVADNFGTFLAPSGNVPQPAHTP